MITMTKPRQPRRKRTPHTLARQAEAERLDRGLTQKEAAGRIGLSQAAWSSMVRGHTTPPPSLQILLRLFVQNKL